MSATGLHQRRRQVERAGLCAPPVPKELAADLTKRDEWFYATRDMNPGAMHSPPRYAAEVVAGPVDDCVALCHTGHGVNSYEIVH